jgi:hypothetical protein
MDLAAATRFSKKLVAAGFLSFGGFHPEDSDQVPDLASGQPARTLLMIGSTGPNLWPVLQAAPEGSDGKADPMDRFTRRVLGSLAGEFGFTALFPFDGPPYHPVQRWALKCGGFSRSPFGLLAHRTYGPWAGLRAVFLSPEHFGTFENTDKAGPCGTCPDKPCLDACPVSAITFDKGYDVPRCLAHLRNTPDASCWSGCLARHACPVGTGHRPSPENARFHMESFTALT